MAGKPELEVSRLLNYAHNRVAANPTATGAVRALQDALLRQPQILLATPQPTETPGERMAEPVEETVRVLPQLLDTKPRAIVRRPNRNST